MATYYETQTIEEHAATAPGEKTEAVTAPSNNRVAIVLALLALYLVWGSTYLAIRYGLEGGFPPFLMGGIRFLLAGGAFYVFLRLRGAPTPSRKQWMGAGAVGALLLGGGNGGVSFAEQWVPSGLAALGVATTPLWVALFSGLWGRWPTRGEWVGLVIGFAGVGLLNLEKGVSGNPLGALGLLAATLCWSFGSMWSKRLSMPEGLMSAAAQMLCGGAVLTVMGLVTGESFSRVPDEKALWAFLYLIVFGAIVGYTAYVYLLSRVRPTLATSYAYVNPIVAVALGVWLAGETITVFGMAAMVVILLSVGILAVTRERTSKEGS